MTVCMAEKLFMKWQITHPPIVCLKLTIETPEQEVKYVQS